MHRHVAGNKLVQRGLSKVGCEMAEIAEQELVNRRRGTSTLYEVETWDSASPPMTR